MTPAAPFISVLMPAFNAERFVARTIGSVLAQTYGNFELIAIDDGSTDGTLAVLRDFEKLDSRIRVVSHGNVGMGMALNRAWPLCRGAWIARIDADDLMMPDRLERQLAFIAEHPNLVVAASLVEYIDEQDRPIGRNESPFINPEVVRTTALTNDLVGIHHPSVLLKADAVAAAGGYRPAFWPCDDVDLWNRLLDHDPECVLVQAEYLVQYRIHDHSVCVSKPRLAQQRIEWVQACLERRRSGKPEPTWEQYLKQRQSAGLWSRLRDNCRATGRTLYKLAAINYSRRRYLHCIFDLAGAALLEPTFVFGRVTPQLARLGGSLRRPRETAMRTGQWRAGVNEAGRRKGA